MHNLIVLSPTSETLKSHFSSVIDYVGLTKSFSFADEAFDAAAEKAAELVDGFYEAGQSAEYLLMLSVLTLNLTTNIDAILFNAKVAGK